MTSKKSVVICKLPKAGLGNQLFPLMNAYMFASLNGLPVIVTGYHSLKLGPYLRNEKSKRRYSGYFIFQKNIIGEAWDKLRIYSLMKRFETVYEPEVEMVNNDDKVNKVFAFSKMPTFHDYFIQLKKYRNKTKEVFYEILNPWIKKKIEGTSTPVIGVHIRMGDFRKLNEDEVFKGGHVRTPEAYFKDIINQIRLLNGMDLPVSVFTDGFKNEFNELFKLNNIHIIEGNADIVDMLLLSKSKIIVTSTGSTFSYWAGFLSNAPLILHPDHIYKPIRNFEESEQLFEGAFDNYHEMLTEQIKNISY